MPDRLPLQRFQERTVPDLLDRSQRFGLDRPILVTTAPESALSYGEFLERVAGCAAVLAARYRPGTRVACLLANGVSYLILRYALTCAGLVEVAVNGQHKGVVLRAMLTKVRPEVIVVADRFRENLSGSGYDLAATGLLDEESLARITARPIAWRERPTIPVGPREPCRILFSSGTTGASKAVELSQAYEVYTGERHGELLDIGIGDRWLYVTPMFHIDAVYIFSIVLHTGAALALAPNFSASRFWRDAANSRASYLCYVGSILAILLKGDGPDEPTPLRLAVGGGATGGQVEEFERRFGVEVLESYAMTECIACTFSTRAGKKQGSIGRPVPGYEVAILDEAGARLPPGACGEIAIRAEEDCALFTRYVGDPEATAQAMRGGWFHTGDLGSRDADGHFHFCGRIKDAIRVGGENVSAQELEAIADSHPAIAASAAVAVPAEIGDDDILLYVELKSGMEVSGQELFAFFAARAAKFMVPRYLRFIERLPRTATERVQKSELARTGRCANAAACSTQVKSLRRRTMLRSWLAGVFRPQFAQGAHEVALVVAPERQGPLHVAELPVGELRAEAFQSEFGVLLVSLRDAVGSAGGQHRLAQVGDRQYQLNLALIVIFLRVRMGAFEFVQRKIEQGFLIGPCLPRLDEQEETVHPVVPVGLASGFLEVFLRLQVIAPAAVAAVHVGRGRLGEEARMTLVAIEEDGLFERCYGLVMIAGDELNVGERPMEIMVGRIEALGFYGQPHSFGEPLFRRHRFLRHPIREIPVFMDAQCEGVRLVAEDARERLALRCLLGKLMQRAVVLVENFLRRLLAVGSRIEIPHDLREFFKQNPIRSAPHGFAPPSS